MKSAKEFPLFQPGGNDGYRDVLDKIRRKTLAHGDRPLMAEFRLGQGAALPRHSHPHEQTGYLVSGQIELTIGDAVAIEVFSPVREDYLPERP